MTMKRIYWIAIIVILGSLCACGDAESKTKKKPSANNQNNTTANNQNNTAANNQNNTSNNTSENNTLTPGNNTKPECSATERYNAVTGECVPAQTGCETRADCSVDAECVEGTCQEHLDCFGVVDGSTVRCEVNWGDCEDEREYRLDCDGGECSCEINQVEVGDFFRSAACQDLDAMHRVANEECGWLVPQAF